MAAILAATACGLVLCSTGASAAGAPIDGCFNGIHVVLAQGTNDPSSTTATTAFKQLPFAGSAKRAYLLPYGPAPLSLLNAATFLDRYHTAVQRGASQLYGLLLDHLSRCPPSEHLVLIGFSQGADVVEQAWNRVMASGGMVKWQGRLDALVLFGHPKFDSRQIYLKAEESLDRGTFLAGRNGFFGSSGVVTWSPSAESDHFMQSWCDRGDTMCNAGGMFPNLVSTYLGAAPSNSPHNSYPKSDTGTAMAELGRWMKVHYPSLS